MAEKKSIYEGALLDIKVIQEALNANTKEILRSVAREEIDGMVKESLEEADYEEEAVEDEIEGSDSEGDETDSPEGDDVEGTEDDDTDIEIGDDEPDDDDEMSPEVGPEDDQEMGMGADDALGGDDLDMTDASDDDVIAIYKKLSGDDEIEIVGDEIHLNISEPGEYIVKKGALGMGGESEMDESMYETNEESMEEGQYEMEESYQENEELTYEIAMGEDSTMMEDEDFMKEDDDIMKEEDEDVKEGAGIGVGMSVGSHRNKTGPGSIGAPEHPKSKNESVSSKNVIIEAEVKYKKLLNEATQLKAENEDFRKALKKFRGMLVETVVFNSNLSYVTKLFMEHSTTKEEKKKIIQRFDEEVTNLKESKKLYKTIVNEISSRKPVNESIGSKLIKEVATGSSKQLNEATAYVDPSTQRIKDLINRVENKDKY